jgi:riboflavin biosynthesis pyrimidine reductase
MSGMRALLPAVGTKVEAEVDVHEFYARDWLDGGGVRANFISSVDGAVTVAGLSRGLQTAGDNKVFAALRDLADVVLVGAGTARAEGYAAIHLSEERREMRSRLGLAQTLPTAIVSRSLRLDPGTALFTDTEPGARTIVLTCQAGDPAVRAALDDVADVVICGDTDVDLVRARGALDERGLRRILCEGGPTLFADLTHAGVLDELCLSVSPLLAGPGSTRISAGAIWPLSAGERHLLRLTGLLEEDSAIFCRYTAVR